jgi:hypothetical protein
MIRWKAYHGADRNLRNNLCDTRPGEQHLEYKVRLYSYIGPPELLRDLKDAVSGSSIRNRWDLEAWIAANGDGGQYLTATFVIDKNGTLRLADRRSEHVHCAEGGPVLSAGEMVFETSELTVAEVTNQSTGFCPEPDSWPAVEAALQTIGVCGPADFTTHFVFRLCPNCGERNVVRDAWFVCAISDGGLPEEWNFDESF